MVDYTVCGRCISMGLHSHRWRSETHTHRAFVDSSLRVHSCILSVFIKATETEGASFSCCLASCSFMIDTTLVRVTSGLQLSDKMLQLLLALRYTVFMQQLAHKLTAWMLCSYIYTCQFWGLLTLQTSPLWFSVAQTCLSPILQRNVSVYLMYGM